MAAYDNRRLEQHGNEQQNIMGEIDDLRDNLEALSAIVSKDRKSVVQANDSDPQKKKKKTEKIYKCELCDQTFSSNFSLKRHNQTYHLPTSTKKTQKDNGEKKAFECNKCKHSFGRKDLLKKHISRKHADPAHSNLYCKQCEKKFVSAYNLKDHVLKCHRRRAESSVSTVNPESTTSS